MKPNIVFLLIDSFSADKFLGPSKTSKTPNLDSVISQGTYFNQTISVASTTVPSYSSMLTGLYPFQCVEKKENVILLKTELKTFIQKFEESGYTVFAELPEIIALSGLKEIIKNCNVFDTFSTLYDNVGTNIENNLSNLKEPWLYYIHLMDIHGSTHVGKNNSEINKFLKPEYGKNNYEKMISAMDYWLGKIFSKINFENTILVITADHGSPVSEYDENMEKENKQSNKRRDSSSKLSYKIGHKVVTNFPEFMNPLRKKLSKTYLEQKNKSITQDVQTRLSKLEFDELSPRKKRLFENAIMTTGNLFDEVCRIPLLFTGFSIPKNKIISKQVKNIDIFPTLYEIISGNSDDNLVGKSLVPLFKDEPFSEDPILLQTIVNTDEIKPKIGIRTSNYKYFRNDEKEPKTRFLFDLNKDPLEENNIAENEDDKVTFFEQQISSILKKSKVSSEPTVISEKEMDDAKELLKKLGYI